MSDITIKSHDTGITFSDTLTLDGVPFDLTSCSVKFLMRLKSGGTAFSATATIVDASAGTVSYQPGANFPTTAGRYYQEWEVTTSASKVLSFPGNSYNSIRIIDDLNGA